MLALALALAAVPTTLAAGDEDEVRPEAAAGFVPEKAERLDDLLEPIRARHKLPALAGAIVTREALTGAGACGTRRAGGDEAVTPRDRFHIGSCTKAMTATLAAMLVEDGKLRWNSTLAEVFPERAERMHADFRGVTLEQLLSHRAGMPQDLTFDGLWGRLWAHKGTGVEQRLTLLDGVTQRAPVHAPGSKYLYSNAGVSIAGAMCERVAGKPWEELMRERLFVPLGMQSAGFGPPGRSGTADDPRGHRRAGETWVPIEPGPWADNPDAIAPGGKVHCSLSDWGRFIALHLYGPRGESALLGRASFEKLHAPVSGQEYALGWGVAQRPWGGIVLTHSGSNTMWHAVTWLSPEKEFGVVVATNVAGEDAVRGCDEAAWALIQHHLGARR